MEAEFYYFGDTKRFHRYNSPEGAPFRGSIYLPKSSEERPKALKVTVEEVSA